MSFSKKKGIALYFGFKFSEQQILYNLSNDPQFKRYYRNTDIDTTNIDDLKNKIQSFYCNDFFKSLYWSYESCESECDDLIFNNFTAELVCCRCCMYDDDSDWILGIPICRLSAFKNKIKETKVREITQYDREFIEKLPYKLRLMTIDKPSFYSIPTDCWCCT